MQSQRACYAVGGRTVAQGNAGYGVVVSKAVGHCEAMDGALW